MGLFSFFQKPTPPHPEPVTPGAPDEPKVIDENYIPKPGEMVLILNDEFRVLNPTPEEVRSSMEALLKAKDSFDILETFWGFVQFAPADTSTFVMEANNVIPDAIAKAKDPLPLEPCLEAILTFYQDPTGWHEPYEWEHVMDVEVHTADVMSLGQFEPRDARTLSDALEKAGIPFEAQNENSVLFQILVSGEDHPRASEVLLQALNVH